MQNFIDKFYLNYNVQNGTVLDNLKYAQSLKTEWFQAYRNDQLKIKVPIQQIEIKRKIH